MRKILILAFAMQLTCSVVCDGQIETYLQDISAKESPVHVSGNVWFDDDASQTVRFSYRIEGTLANASSTGLVLVVIHVTGKGLRGPALDYSYQEDYFFGLKVLEPGGGEAFSSLLRFGMPTVNGIPVPEDDEISLSPS